jgi:hypothetical protein
MADIARLSAMQAFLDNIGAILEAAEGGTCDIFEIKIQYEATVRKCARLDTNATSTTQAPESPRAVVARNRDAPSSSPAGATRSIAKNTKNSKAMEEVMKTYKSLPAQRPRPRGFAPGHRVRVGGPGAVPPEIVTQVTTGKLKHCPPCEQPYAQACHCAAQGLGDCCLKEGSTLFVFLQDELNLARGSGQLQTVGDGTGFHTAAYEAWVSNVSSAAPAPPTPTTISPASSHASYHAAMATASAAGRGGPVALLPHLLDRGGGSVAGADVVAAQGHPLKKLDLPRRRSVAAAERNELVPKGAAVDHLRAFRRPRAAAGAPLSGRARIHMPRLSAFSLPQLAEADILQ